MGLLQTAISGQRVRSNHAHIVGSLGRDIVSGAIPSGATLPGDAELMARFGVSRTVLREALKTLAAKGLIVPRAGIGTRVTGRENWSLFDPDILNWHFDCGIDEAFLVHLSEIRLAFEPYAAALAAERATPEDIVRLDQLADDMGRVDHTPESHTLADLRFHLAVAEASRNPFLRSVGSLIEAALVGVFRLSSPTTDRQAVLDASQSHRAIVEAIRRRDRAGARAAMEAVIITGLERVRAALHS
ncbi:FadR family transcriptional regulator [Pseudaminobacter sp. 19-2017]|uniref:FadR family transcriptional regulator n=1 Tax=Pseudaminobacter soli (ex Zhang et al. 2022) TaxID=2831468 RepID=A0A942E1P8_9HYPH|nr:FadR/GntR family transcriptional regulator [Pseudaminobacter soli]MBS3652154.1 FadR family transcriptional regulator [Pseudaminobacter soli]